MGSLLSYAISSAILLTASYLPYKWLLSGIRRPGVNRLTILTIYAVSLFSWPLSVYIHSMFSTVNTNITIQIDGQIISSIAASPQDSSLTIFQWLLIFYLIGIALMTLRWIIAAVNIHRIISHCEKTEINGIKVCVSDIEGIAPFSVFGRIVIPRKDLCDSDLIVSHERVHISRHHSIDLVVAQIVTILQWFNPASWLMIRELRAVHEYEADNGVIDSGADIKEYQLLLIKKAVGDRLPSPANSLNHSNLKLRITMMYESKKMGNRRWRYLALVPAVAAALSVTNLKAVADTLQKVSSADLPEIFNNEVMEIFPTEQIADKPASIREEAVSEMAADNLATAELASTTAVENKAISGKDEDNKPIPDEAAEYPGGMGQLMNDLMRNIKYPEAALKENKQGKVELQFVVGTDGKISEVSVIRSQGSLLDNAAIEALKGLKDFVPAKINGKPIAVHYVIPVEFKTTSGEPKSKLSVTFNDKRPAIEIDGEIRDMTALSEIAPNDIESMTIKKDDPQYPDGKIIVKLKK